MDEDDTRREQELRADAAAADARDAETTCARLEPLPPRRTPEEGRRIEERDELAGEASWGDEEQPG